MAQQLMADRARSSGALEAVTALLDARRFPEAEAHARRWTEFEPANASALLMLGRALLSQGQGEPAAEAFRRALEVQPDLRAARRTLALLLLRLGQMSQSVPLFHAEIGDAEGFRWLQEEASRAMRGHDLRVASALQSVSAYLRLSAPGRRAPVHAGLKPFPIQSPQRRISAAKLRHDIDQYDYLRRRGILVDALEPVIAAHMRVLERIAGKGDDARLPLSGENLADIGETFNRVLYLRPTPRVARALSSSWDPIKAESQYLDHPPGVVVIDDFLSAEALSELHAFCLESTVWFANRYGHGRLGAFFHEGFNCPLLVQIAEELRDAFPRMIGRRHSLRQLWGFKNAPDQPGDTTTHADFAAVNVNVWITPDEANLDPETGGLVMYNVDAPPHWDFKTYNGRHDIIKPFLTMQKARTLIIPYRRNRAVIFNSDLFHGTMTVRFRPEYEWRRMNVTMLYGVREDDHRSLAKPDPMTDPTRAGSRSAAFSRRRSGL